MRLALPLLAVLCVACTPPAFKDTDQRIGEFTRKQKTAPPEKLPVLTPTGPVSPDQSAALDNYKNIAELATDPEVRAEALRRYADLQTQLLEQEVMGNESDDSQRKAIELYERLLTEKPASDPDNARLLYQLSRAYQNVGDNEKAAETLQQLTERYPDSEFAADGHFRRAEQLYRLEDYAEAELEYRTVTVNQKATPFFEPAQYKLAWSLYKQAKYEDTLDLSLAILDRELPPGELSDPAAALDATARGKREIAQDALRLTSLALSNLGDAAEINRALAARPQPRFYPLIYTALGAELLDKKRYTDAAKAYAAFGERYTRHPLAPLFQNRVIGAYRDGGFADLVMVEKERYATRFDPAAPYWSGREPPADVRNELRQHLDDLGRFHQARAQSLRESDPKAAQKDFTVAAHWYERRLELFPADAGAAELNVLLADALLESGQTLEAARQYEKAAFGTAANTERGADAAYAAVLAYQKNAAAADASERTPALKQAVAAGLKFADSYPKHPQAAAVLTRSAEDLYALKDYDAAISTGARVVRSPSNAAMKRSAWTVVADAQFTRNRYPEAEAAYAEALSLTPNGDPQYSTSLEQLAAAIYKQGEAAREAKRPRDAAAAFLRVGQRAPTAKIRSTAEYDAAASLIVMEDWANAGKVLEGFRIRYPDHPLTPDVDKKLAAVYQKTNRPDLAATALGRISNRGSETADTRREAAWLAAKYYDDTGNPQAAVAYENYLSQYPRPVERAIEVRSRLAELDAARGRDERHLERLRDIVAADATAGSERTARTRFLSAQAQLTLAQRDAEQTRKMALRLPLDKSIPKKQASMEQSIAALTRVSSSGFAEVSTAATYELGSLYRNFAQSLMSSDRPRKLSALELEQYNILLEEQAYPFEEKAIEWHEANLKLAAKGNYDAWIGRSARELGEISPGRYGRREMRPEIYDALR